MSFVLCCGLHRQAYGNKVYGPTTYMTMKYQMKRSLDGGVCPSGCLPSVRPSNRQNICPVVRPSINALLSLALYACPTYLPTCLSVHLSVCLSVRPSVRLSTPPSVHPSVLPACLPARPCPLHRARYFIWQLSFGVSRRYSPTGVGVE
jgi:hypothetical protein